MEETTPDAPTLPTFTFAPRWKEEMVCTCDRGALVLEMTMYVIIVYLPTADRWTTIAPAWAIPLYDTLRNQLAAWCREQNIPLHIDPTAAVWADGA